VTQEPIPTFEMPKPTRVEQTGEDSFAIFTDTGYRPNVEFVHEKCGNTHNILYWPEFMGFGKPRFVCDNCREDVSRKAHIDRFMLEEKIASCLMWMSQDAKSEVYISNGAQGEWIGLAVAQKCVQARDFSEGFIREKIFEEVNNGNDTSSS